MALICAGLYISALVLGYLVMGDITDKYRWDLLFTFWAGMIYILLTVARE